MISKPNGSAKKNLTYHNALIFHKSQNLTVKDQIDVTNLWKSRPVGGSEIFARTEPLRGFVPDRRA
jgi:hypothetical protein